MQKYKKLIVTIMLLLAILLLSMLILPKGANRAKEDENSVSHISNSKTEEFVFVDEELPNGYVAVLGYDDIYQIVIDGNLLGYKIRILNGDFMDYDINKPGNYIIHDVERQIYKAVNSSGNLMYYRKFNGKEWDVVSADGKLLLAVPGTYERCDDSQEIYVEVTDEGKYVRRLSKFADGSFAWTVVESPQTTTTVPETTATAITTTTVVTTVEPDEEQSEASEETDKVDEEP